MTMIAQRSIAPAAMAHQPQNPLAKCSPKYTTGPLPSIERRNARERNRVKQVNNGFDKLRQYIPAKVVQAENGGRAASKKLSKVDTLKLAVKYIQRLTEMLDAADSRLPQTSALQSPASSLCSASSYYSASPAPSMEPWQTQPQMPYPSYASTPLPQYQAPVSPAPSYHSDASSHAHSAYPLQPPQGYTQPQFEEEDSFEEEGLLDDILQWQMQN